MPALPSALALDLTIGPTIASGEHASNYTAIQTAVNAIIAALNVGSGSAPYLTGNGATLTWAAISGAISSYATTLPGSPTDGQLAVLVDSVTLPTYHWLFRYNSGSSNADKWDFIGGSPAIAEVTTAETTASTSYVALATAGPSFTIPRAGQYLVEIGCLCGKSAGSADATVTMSYDIGGTGAVDADGTIGTFSLAAAGDHSVPTTASRVRQKTIASAATALVAKYKVSAATASISARWMRVTPVRVS